MVTSCIEGVVCWYLKFGAGKGCGYQKDCYGLFCTAFFLWLVNGIEKFFAWWGVGLVQWVSCNQAYGTGCRKVK